MVSEFTPTAQQARIDDTVRLLVIEEGATRLRATLTAHRLPKEQQQFAAPAAESLPLGDADPGRISVAILAGDEPVGMFALDRGGYFREFETTRTRSCCARSTSRPSTRATATPALP